MYIFHRHLAIHIAVKILLRKW